MRQIRRMRTLLAAMVTAVVLAAGGMQAATIAAAIPSPPLQQPVPVTAWNHGTMGGASWMVKANDYAEGPPMWGHWSWIMCGESVAYGAESAVPSVQPFSQTTWSPCEPGQVATYASYSHLATAIHRAPAGRTFVFDPETWDLTPPWEQANQALYIRKACVLAHQHGDKVIVTPEGPAVQLPAQYKAGAAYCDVVEAQTQGAERFPATFRARVQAFLKIVRAVPRHAPAMIGLASDPGGSRATVSQLVYAYRYARSMGVTRFWMNMDAWWGRSWMDGTGDQPIAAAFFRAIGEA